MCLYKARKGTVNWSELCNDILRLIMVKLLTIEDIVHFGAVCRHWRSVSVENRHLSNRAIVVPWLMLADPEDNDSRGLYSVSTQKVYHLNFPEARNRRCWSSQDWLITEGLDWEYHLLNPFSRVIIRLPSQPTFIYNYQADVKFTPEDQVSHDRGVGIKKMVLSSTPSPSVETTTPSCKEEDEDDEKCVVMALSSDVGRLSFLRLGDEVWRAIDCPTLIEDVTYFNGQFYAIDYMETLYICDISSLEPKIILFAEPEGVFEDINESEFYLMESVGELIVVLRSLCYGENGDRVTIDLDVYKFDFDNRKWTEVKSLDNRALFLGHNSSFAIFSPNHHPGCELNCIYYTNFMQRRATEDMEVFSDETQETEYLRDTEDMEVFNMETHRTEYLSLDFLPDSCTPLWICHPL